MKVFVENKEYNLDEKTAMSGGEGTVYINGNTAFKIYHSKDKMIPLGKFQELNQINVDNVIKPKQLIYDHKNNIIGYTMKAVFNTVQLSRIVTKDYQQQHGITHDILINIMLKIKETISLVHNNNCLIVDINDSNILIDDHYNVFFIDVDSYKTKNYPATALQDYAKDFSIKENKFSELSDWFSFGLLSTKLLIGIHPYMGRWNKYKKRAKENSLSYRSENNISIFNDEVVYPKSVKSFSFIPQNYYKWFLDIFEKGKRILPPVDIGDFFSTSEELILKSEVNVLFKKALELNFNITNIFNGFREQIIFGDNECYFNNNSLKLSQGKKIVIFNQKDEPILLKINNDNYIETYNLLNNENQVHEQIKAESIFSFNNELYAKYEDNFMHLEIVLFGKMIISVKKTFPIMPYSCDFFENCIYQNTLNKSFFYLIHNKDSIPLIKIKELDGKNIINSKYSNFILNVVVQENNCLKHYIFKINEDFKTYKIIYSEQTDDYNINCTVNEQGVSVFIPSDDNILIFFNNYNNDNIREVKDKNINSNMNLFSFNSNIYVHINKVIYQIKLS